MSEQVMRIAGMSMVLVPNALLCTLPFLQDLKVSRRTFILSLCALLVVHIAISAFIVFGSFFSDPLWEVYVMCMLLVCFVYYTFCVNIPAARLLYMFLVVASYATYITGLSNVLEFFLSPATFDTHYSSGFLWISTTLLALTSPLMYYFLHNKVRLVMLQVDTPAWKTMWLIPLIFYFLILVLGSAFNYEIYATWQYIVTLLLVAVGSFMIYYLVLRMLWQTDQNARLTQLTEELQARNSMRDALLQNISHDLRAPITVIRTAADILEERDLDEQDARAVNRIVRRTADLEKMAEDLYELSTIENGVLSMVRESISIQELFTHLSDEYRPICEKNGLAFRTNPIDGHIWGDRNRLNEVFDNLILNAIKQTERGNITLSAAQSGSIVVFSVQDTGRGIPEQELSRIFDRFYRYGSQSPENSGLGLAICKALVERMGGRIQCESKLGEGSSFHFTLEAQGGRMQAESQLSG